MNVIVNQAVTCVRADELLPLHNIVFEKSKHCFTFAAQFGTLWVEKWILTPGFILKNLGNKNNFNRIRTLTTLRIHCDFLSVRSGLENYFIYYLLLLLLGQKWGIECLSTNCLSTFPPCYAGKCAKFKFLRICVLLWKQSKVKEK